MNAKNFERYQFAHGADDIEITKADHRSDTVIARRKLTRKSDGKQVWRYAAVQWDNYRKNWQGDCYGSKTGGWWVGTLSYVADWVSRTTANKRFAEMLPDPEPTEEDRLEYERWVKEEEQRREQEFLEWEARMAGWHE